MMTCFFCGDGSRFDNQMKIITISVSTANRADVDSAETAMSYFVSLICGERTERVARGLGFSAIDMNAGRLVREHAAQPDCQALW